jgi:DNA polymerase-3 subunit gamma/tau
VRDLLVLSVDPSRISDPEIAGEGERDRLKGLTARFSREDLLRAFDLLTRADSDIRTAPQPRYHLEMALLRWIYVRKLVPIEDLIAASGSTRPGAPKPAAPSTVVRASPKPSGAGAAPASPAAGRGIPAGRAPAFPAVARPEPVDGRAPAATAASPASFKDALLAEVRRTKEAFHGMVLAPAQNIEVTGDRVTVTFSAGQRTQRDQFEQNRAWLESIAQQVAGRRIAVACVLADAPAPPGDGAQKAADRKAALREQALADAGVQAMLDVFPAEIRDVEEM